MATDPPSLGELLQKEGAVAARVLRKQFTSLSSDTIDDIVSEAVGRVWSRCQHTEDRSLFPLIFRVARNQAIDRLRTPKFIEFLPTESLDHVKSCNDSLLLPEDAAPSQLVTALRDALEGLCPLDRRILESSITHPLSDNWAIELAHTLLEEEEVRVNDRCDQTPEERSSEIDPDELAKLSGRLRIRRLRAIEKLRTILSEQGFHTPIHRRHSHEPKRNDR